MGVHATEYVAVWADAARPNTRYAGRLGLSGDGYLRLEGSGNGSVFSRAIHPREITSVERTRGSVCFGGRSCLRLNLRSGGALLIRTILGTATLTDLHDTLSLLAG